ncbi:MAG: hypothetical protein SPD47_01195 [Oscillospiraceae bacterium]|nr:hypothetical protein [Oscillospiraceae bacterium]
MPHSGGGGSHGGGSHGGSHRSGGSGSSNRVSQSYFRGAHRFVYYYHGRPHFYYANRKVTPNSIAAGISFIIFAVMWLLMSLPVVIMSISDAFVSGPLSLDYDTKIVIDDEIGIVDNKAELTDSFEAFQEKTGVTFSIVTRSPENEYMGNSYETQAYNCYVSRWDDERHWLIYYVGSSLDRTDDWHWELMCGDECTKILSTSVEDQFTSDFHRYLVANERYSFDKAVLAALNNINVQPGSIKTDDFVLLLTALIFPAFGIVILVAGIKTVIKSFSEEEKAKSQAVEINVGSACQEVVCDYCNGVYIKHTCVECPHCGAPVKVDNTNQSIQ